MSFLSYILWQHITNALFYDNTLKCSSILHFAFAVIFHIHRIAYLTNLVVNLGLYPEGTHLKF